VSHPHITHHMDCGCFSEQYKLRIEHLERERNDFKRERDALREEKLVRDYGTAKANAKCIRCAVDFIDGEGDPIVIEPPCTCRA